MHHKSCETMSTTLLYNLHTSWFNKTCHWLDNVTIKVNSNLAKEVQELLHKQKTVWQAWNYASKYNPKYFESHRMYCIDETYCWRRHTFHTELQISHQRHTFTIKTCLGFPAIVVQGCYRFHCCTIPHKLLKLWHITTLQCSLQRVAKTVWLITAKALKSRTESQNYQIRN